MKLRPAIVVTLSLFAFGAVAHGMPTEPSTGKVDETPLLQDELRSVAAAPTDHPAPESSASPVASQTVKDEIPTAPASDAPTAPVAAGSTSSEADLKSTVNLLRAKLSVMESRIDELTRQLEGKADAKQKSPKAKTKAAPQPTASIDPYPVDEHLSAEAVPAPVNERAGVPVQLRDEPSDPEIGFANDATIQAFRSAMILHRAGKFSEAVLAFSSFVENNPDHPLAGTAQFYVGNSYFKQKEYQLAIQEYQRVLTTYDRSTHIAQTLREISDAEDAIRKTGEAAKHRQLLMSLFPHSPFALTRTAEAPKLNTPEKAPEQSPEKAQEKSKDGHQ